MIKEKVQEAINEQIAKEMYSANLYLAMAAYYKKKNLNGFANWMRVQAQEETAHAMKFFDFLIDRGGEVKILPIEAPELSWDSPLKAFEAALAHEVKVTASINNIADIAMIEKDFATSSFLQWFINEQVEEEANTGEIVDRMQMAEGSRGALFMLDTELKSRVFTPPPPNNAQ
jgi:ferritin